MSKNFTKVVESFDCENCGTYNNGNGYTNHCYNCLFSKHVDINPGDRGNSCHGIMKPIARTLNKKKITTIIHQCNKCLAIKKNKTIPLDNFTEILKLPFC